MVSPAGTDPRAWRADTIDSPEAWYFNLPETCLAALDEDIQEFRRHPVPVADLRPSEQLRSSCGKAMQPALDALETGRGFVIIRGVPAERYSADELKAIYWLIGHLLGVPFEQNVQGTLLYDVKDTGQDVRYGARFSVTNAESTFHTDNSFGDEVLDYVGLLCLNTARSGGLNQVVSGYAVCQELQEQHPDVIKVLMQPYHVDRRGGVKPGQEPIARYPVVAWSNSELLCRYLRYWIEVGHDRAGEPLTLEQRRALDVLDETMRQRSLQVEFGLQPGDMFFINNRWILHNRTAFEDHPEPERRRHYLRLWLKAARN